MQLKNPWIVKYHKISTWIFKHLNKVQDSSLTIVCQPSKGNWLYMSCYSPQIWNMEYPISINVMYHQLFELFPSRVGPWIFWNLSVSPRITKANLEPVYQGQVVFTTKVATKSPLPSSMDSFIILEHSEIIRFPLCIHH